MQLLFLQLIYFIFLFVSGGHHISNSGLLILTGLIIFVTVEKLFSVIEQLEKNYKNTENTPENNNTKGLKQPVEQKKSVSSFLSIWIIFS